MSSPAKDRGDRAENRTVRNAQQRALRERNKVAITGDEPWHGTMGGYANHCCRCAPCYAAYKAYNDEWRKRPDVAERRRAQAREIAKRPHVAHARRAKNYGLTPDELHRMLAVNECSACRTTDPGFHGWAVDHDHQCCPGKTACGACVRGILCRSCNTALGQVNDNLEQLRSLIAYLERQQ